MGTGHMDWPVPIGIFERLRGEKNWHVSSSQGPAYLHTDGFVVLCETLCLPMDNQNLFMPSTSQSQIIHI